MKDLTYELLKYELYPQLRDLTWEDFCKEYPHLVVDKHDRLVRLPDLK